MSAAGIVRRIDDSVKTGSGQEVLRSSKPFVLKVMLR